MLMERSNGSNLIEMPYVLFPNLQTLVLNRMKNIKDIWGSQIRSGSFRNLEGLRVSRCDKLNFVFTHAIARYLVHLRKLSIKRCALLEVVIAKEEEEVKDTTLFPELNSVPLYKLPALESFCYVVHELEFRVLKDVKVVKCPKLKTFSLAHVLTPDLYYVTVSEERVWADSDEETVWADDLNSTIKQLHEQVKSRITGSSSVGSSRPGSEVSEETGNQNPSE